MRRVIYDDGEDTLILDDRLAPNDTPSITHRFLKHQPTNGANGANGKTIYMFDRVEAELFARDLLAFVKGGE